MERNMHIVFLDFDDVRNSLLSGGQGRATYEVAKRLVAEGNRVTVICNRYPGSQDRTEDGIVYRHIGLGSRNIRANNVAYFFALPLAVMRLKADVIIECFTAPISTSFAPLFTSIPVIGMPTMFEAKEFAKKYFLPFHWIEALGCKFYKYFLAYSAANKVKMERLNPSIITRVIPNGVSEEFFGHPTKDENYAFFIGRIDIRQKGLDLLLEACRKLRGHMPVKIVIAGNGPKDEELKLRRLIEEYGVGSDVEFVGRVDGKRKEELLANCSFGIYPSRWEDFPLVPLEFAAFGKALVSYDIEGLSWVPEKASRKAKSFDVDSLAEQILAVGGNPSLRQSLIPECRNFAKGYGWNSIALEYADFCHQVVALENLRKVEAIA